MIVINSILFVGGFFTVFAIVRAAATEETADQICGILYTLITCVLLVSWFRTKAVVILPGLLMNLTVAVYFYTHARVLAIVVNLILLLIGGYILTHHLRHHSIYRKLLELAAGTVDSTLDGYTQRSYPAGKADFSKGELLGFAGFLKKHLIAVPVIGNESIVFLLPEDWFGYLLDIKKDDDKVTRITCGYNGNVSVSIARNDYEKFKQTLTFDQLCDSLGNLFKDFLDQYKAGESGRILDSINSLKTIPI